MPTSGDFVGSGNKGREDIAYIRLLFAMIAHAEKLVEYGFASLDLRADALTTGDQEDRLRIAGFDPGAFVPRPKIRGGLEAFPGIRQISQLLIDTAHIDKCASSQSLILGKLQRLLVLRKSA